MKLKEKIIILLGGFPRSEVNDILNEVEQDNAKTEEVLSEVVRASRIVCSCFENWRIASVPGKKAALPGLTAAISSLNLMLGKE